MDEFIPTRNSLLSRLRDWDDHESWLELIVRRRAADHLRRARVRPAAQSPAEAGTGTAQTPTMEQIPDPAGDVIAEIWEEEWARNVADVAMDRVKARVSAKQFQMFDLYAVKGWSVRDVARALRANVAQVYLTKHRLTAMLRKETATLRKRMDTDGGLAS